jgi:hypothetical protein
LTETAKPVSVEILYFEGCPNHKAARALVERVARDEGIGVALSMVNLPDAEAAKQMRFLGSPSVRVEGIDVEPGAEKRTEFVDGCRVYRTEDGFAGQPSEDWLRSALRGR